MKGRTGYITISLLLFLLSACSPQNKEKQASIHENLETLKQMETLNMGEVSTAVTNAQKALYRDKLQSGSLSYRDMFSNAVVMGDSIAAGLDEYGLLDPIQVVAARGRNLNTIDEDIDKVILLAPSHIFFSYGMNDIGNCDGDVNAFIARYEEVIKEIQAGIPNVKLHVNAILPIQQNAIDADPLFAVYTDFNAALKEMSKRLQVDFVDNEPIITEHNIGYNPDGIHPLFDFYPLWLLHMAERM